MGIYASRPPAAVKKQSGSGSEPPWSWVAPGQWEADKGSQQEGELIRWLMSGDRAQQAEAQIRLLPLGAALLPKLEALARREPETEEALLEFLRLLTAHRVEPDMLGDSPALSALAAKDLARGRKLVAAWEKAPSKDELVEHFPFELCGTPPLPPTWLSIEGPRLQALRNSLWALGGLARPGIERMLASPSANVRLQGIVIADELGFRPAPATLTRLRSDPGTVELEAQSTSLDGQPDRERHRSKVLLSKRASLLVDALDAHKREYTADDPIAFRIEEVLTEWLKAGGLTTVEEPAKAGWLSMDLINSLRQQGGFQAATEQEYWNRVRPLWRLWWLYVAPDAERYARSEWLALESSRDGIQIQWGAEEKGTALRLEGPAGMKVEVLSHSFPGPPTVVQRGVLPLTVESKERLNSVGLRLLMGTTWVDSGAYLAPSQARMTVWIHPKLFQRFLASRKH
ncbi:hypothetical protein [Corallococcus sp. CA053C]|uniref:hypothetical protein n=1 Tax=Corallococcus sp. CA053C TaxID=2316732 RepID=UPI0011C36414|nr:hypothetical protein [Corallococcus sp. CA053C]